MEGRPPSASRFATGWHWWLAHQWSLDPGHWWASHQCHPNQDIRSSENHSTGNKQTRHIPALVVDDLAAADGDLADGVGPAAGHGHVDGPIAVGEPDGVSAEGIAGGHPVRVALEGVGEGDLHAFLGSLTRPADDPAL